MKAASKSAKLLDEKGFIFRWDDNNIYRCCMWGESPWLMRWNPAQNLWVSVQRLTQMDIFTLPHNLSEEEQEVYHRLEAEQLKDMLPSSPNKTTDPD